jgi:arylsulfatase A-like enzyme
MWDGGNRTWRGACSQQCAEHTAAVADYSGDEGYYSHKGDCGGYDLKLEDAPNCGLGCSRHYWEAQGHYSTHLFTKRAVSIIGAHNQTKPLFLYLPYQAVHVPDEVPNSYVAPYSFPKVEGSNARNIFAGMLACLDEGIGNITAALRSKRMFDETLIWFQTDNGAATPACGGWTGGMNWPLRGGKCTAWEGGLRGVAFISGAGIAPSRRGSHVAGLMHTVDVLPTLVDALGGEASSLTPKGFPLDGVSQWPMLSRGETGSRDTVLLECDPLASPFSNRPPGFVCSGDEHATPYYALRQNNWKLIIGDPGMDDRVHPSIGNGLWCTGPPCPADYNNTATAAGPYSVDSVMLFDLSNDTTESHNVAAAHQDVVTKLKGLIQAFNASAVSSLGVCAPAEPAQAPSMHNGTCTPWAAPPIS